MLILVSGLPASGKSYFAAALQKTIDARYLSSDIVRSEMNLRGRYDPAIKELVYTEMLVRAGRSLVDGQRVIVDGTFSRAADRQRFYELAERWQRPFFVIVIKAAEETIAQRMTKKRAYSEADFEVYLKIREQYEPIGRHHLILWSDGQTLDEMLTQALDYLCISQLAG
ncbi:MAG: AAA family ATPase [Bacteroidota bacterium]